MLAQASPSAVCLPKLEGGGREVGGRNVGPLGFSAFGRLTWRAHSGGCFVEEESRTPSAGRTVLGHAEPRVLGTGFPACAGSGGQRCRERHL